MNVSEFFPMWEKLTPPQRRRLEESAAWRRTPAGTVLRRGGDDCLGLLLVAEGQLRASLLSPEGREITIYRLFSRDICLFSASCMMRSIQFDITIAGFYLIPAPIYQGLMEESAQLANYTNEIMATRFSEVMWLMEQVMWRRFDQRLAAFLLEESQLEGEQTLRLTHEKIAAHLGTAREVVTRMLRYFQSEGMVRLARGTVELTDPAGLEALAEP